MQILEICPFKKKKRILSSAIDWWGRLREHKPLAPELCFHVSDIGNIMKTQWGVMEGDKSGETWTD